MYFEKFLVYRMNGIGLFFGDLPLVQCTQLFVKHWSYLTVQLEPGKYTYPWPAPIEVAGLSSELTPKPRFFELFGHNWPLVRPLPFRVSAVGPDVGIIPFFVLGGS